MKDKYGETIRCSNCRSEIENKKDLHLNRIGMIYCTQCQKLQNDKDFYNVADDVLGTRTPCNIPMDEYEMGDVELRNPTIRETNRRKIDKCELCLQKTIFFIWSTSQRIDKDILSKIKEFRHSIYLERIGHPICCACVKKEML